MQGKENFSVVLLTNWYNQHQSALAEALYRMIGDRFTFIATEHSKTIKTIGVDFSVPFLRMMPAEGEQYNACRNLINCADVVIIGMAPDRLITDRLKAGKLTFRASERFYKEKPTLWNYPHHLAGAWRHHRRFLHYPLYMLCASAYTAADCRRFGSYRNKTYQWGYFPMVKEYPDIDAIVKGKKHNQIVWCGNIIELKHPEKPILVAKRLASEHIDFELTMIGTGALLPQMQRMIAENGLSERVSLLGTMPNTDVRRHMEEARCFLFTSDRREGWGAVLNEAMNSGCAVVAGHEIGSVPYLIKHRENGLIYRDDDFNDLYEKTKWVLEHPDACEAMGRQAYYTMKNDWNAEVAAERFLALAQAILKGEESPDLFADGVCRRAECLEDEWFHEESYVCDPQEVESVSCE